MSENAVLIKTMMPQTNHMPVYSIFDPDENTLVSFPYRKWAALEYAGVDLEHHKSSKSHRHLFYRYLVHDRHGTQPYDGNTFVYTGDNITCPEAFHFVAVHDASELAAMRSTADIKALAERYGIHVHIPPDEELFRLQFQVVESFFIRLPPVAETNKNPNRRWLETFQVEDLITMGFLRYHLKGLQLPLIAHIDHSIIVLIARNFGFQLGIDDYRQYGTARFRNRFRNLIMMPKKLPGTVLNYTRPYPTRLPQRMNSGFRQQIRDYDKRLSLVT